MIEAYKYLNDLSPDVMSIIFKLGQNSYNLRNFHIFECQNPKTKKFGLKLFNFRKMFPKCSLTLTEGEIFL